MRDLQTLTAQKEAIRLQKAKRNIIIRSKRRVTHFVRVSHPSHWLPTRVIHRSPDEIYSSSGNACDQVALPDPTLKPRDISPPRVGSFEKPSYMDFSSHPASSETLHIQPWIPPNVQMDFFDSDEFNQCGPSTLPDSCIPLLSVPSRTIDGAKPNFMCGLSTYWRPKKRPTNPLAKQIDAFYTSTFLRALSA